MSAAPSTSAATPATPAAPATRGGTIEPAPRATVAIERFHAAPTEAGERYELHDPATELTYRTRSLAQMVARAEQLGAHRFIAVADDGRRTMIQKEDGEWHWGPQRPTLPERPLDRTPARDEVPDGTNGVAPPGPAQAKAGPAGPTPAAHAEQADKQTDIQTDTRATARINAQAERAALVARLEAALLERYIIKRAPVTVGDVTLGHTEYRFRGDSTRVAFTESTFRLATDTNSPSVARSMVDVAEARNWKALRVSGNEDFRRMVWLEASVRGVKTLGYEPNPADLELLRREHEARLVNRIEPGREAAREATPQPATHTQPPPADKPSGRGSGGRKAVLAAIEAVLIDRKVPEAQRAAVMAAATEKLAQRARDGQVPKIRVYDKTAPAQRPTVSPVPDIQRTRDRASLAHAR